MRLDLNLASRPYEDVGEFYRTWGLLAGLVGIITLVLIGLSISSLLGAREVGKQTDQLKKQMAQLDQQKRSAEEMLNRPENRDVRDRSRFLNSLIARKAFSWTEVFADLEKIIPARVKVVSIKPGLTPDNQITVEMKVDADSREKNVEFVRRLNQSKSFRQAVVKSESAQTASGSNTRVVQFEIDAMYAPREPGKPSPEPEQRGAQ